MGYGRVSKTNNNISCRGSLGGDDYRRKKKTRSRRRTCLREVTVKKYLKKITRTTPRATSAARTTTCRTPLLTRHLRTHDKSEHDKALLHARRTISEMAFSLPKRVYCIILLLLNYCRLVPVCILLFGARRRHEHSQDVPILCTRRVAKSSARVSNARLQEYTRPVSP